MKSKQVVLQNGLRVFAVSLPHFKTVSIHAWVFCGSAFEDEKCNGISHFLEHMMFRGNRKIGNSYEVNLAFESLGGDINASTTSDLTEYWFSFHQKYINEGISRFCKFLQEPAMEKPELEKSIILEEIKADYDEHDQLINTISLASNRLWPNAPLGFPVIGQPEIVNQISLEELQAWHQEYYQPQNMVIGISGNLDVEEALQVVEKEFQSIPSGKRHYYPGGVAAPEKGEQIILVKHRDNQFNIQWSFPVHSLTPRLKTCLNIMVRALDDGFCSRLQKEIREEKGLVYEISGAMEFLTDQAVFSIQAVVSEEKLLELMDSLTALVKDLQVKGITSEEWNLTKSRYMTSLDTYSDTPQGVLYEMVMPDIYPGSVSVEETLKQIEELDKQDVDQVVMDCLNQQNTVFVGVGPFEKPQTEYIQKLLQEWTK